MLLKDCPVGSVVRCVKWGVQNHVIPDYIDGNFEVMKGPEKYIIDNAGVTWFGHDCEDDDFEIISYPEPKGELPTHKTIYLKGKHYNLKPLRGAEVIEIDGVEYYMEEKK